MCVCVSAEQVEVRYRLDGSRDAEILRSKVRNLANGHPHAVTINRWADTVFVQVHRRCWRQLFSISFIDAEKMYH